MGHYRGISPGKCSWSCNVYTRSPTLRDYASSSDLWSRWALSALTGLVHDRSNSICLLCNLASQPCAILSSVLEVCKTGDDQSTCVKHVLSMCRYTLFIILYPMGVAVSCTHAHYHVICDDMLSVLPLGWDDAGVCHHFGFTKDGAMVFHHAQ